MAFLEPETYVGTWIEVRHTAGSASWIPYDVLGGDPDSYTPADVLRYTDALGEDDVEEILVHRNAIGVRLSAPGYMDATEWSVHETVEDARSALADELDMGEGTDTDGRDVGDVARDAIPDDENRVRVEFVRQREGEDWEREPVAVFPELEEDPRGLVRTYVHVGQHGAGDLALLRGDEYESTDDGDDATRKLADELERVGYTFTRTRTVYVADDEPEGGDGPGEGTAPPDEPEPTGGESVCPECERGLGDDYTDGCDACEEDLAEKRATDAYAELRTVREELGTALGARDDALAELGAAHENAEEVQDRADMLGERVRELEARAEELETILAEEDREPCERCTETLAEEGASVCPDCAGSDEEEAHRAALDAADALPEGALPPTCSTYDAHAIEDGRCECGPDPCPNAYKLAREAEERAGRLRPGTLATFTPTATRDAAGLDLQTRRGSRVSIVRRLGPGDADLAETGPMFRVRFQDGAHTDAFLDELEPEPGPYDGAPAHARGIECAPRPDPNRYGLAEGAPPFGAAGMSEEARLLAFARRALELVGVSEEERARAEARGESPPLGWGDRFAIAASRWGLRPGTRAQTAPEDAPGDEELESPRFWINVPAGPEAPGADLFAIVDEELGGEIAYCTSREHAGRIAGALNRDHEANPPEPERDTRRPHERFPEDFEPTGEPGEYRYRPRSKRAD